MSSVEVISCDRLEKPRTEGNYVWMSSAYWWILTWLAAAMSLTGAMRPTVRAQNLVDTSNSVLSPPAATYWERPESVMNDPASLMLSRLCQMYLEVTGIGSSGSLYQKQQIYWVPAGQYNLQLSGFGRVASPVGGLEPEPEAFA